MTRVRLVMFWALALSALAASVSAQTTIAVNGTQPPDVVSTQAGTVATVVVTNGPGNTTDWIALFPAGADTAYLDWKYLNGSTAPPSIGLTSAAIQQLLPVAPGNYELRLFASNGISRSCLH